MLVVHRLIFKLLVLWTLSLVTLVSSSSEFDVDGNGVDDALTDGLLVLRHQFGIEGSALTSGALAQDATVTNPDAIASYINQRASTFDLDGNSSVDALTDGLLLLRYLFGLSGDVMINGVIGLDATRDNYAEISAHITNITTAPAAPEITTTSLSLIEHTTSAGSISATDPNGDTISYSISGGDSDELLISSSGLVEFKTAPDYEVKNSYLFLVKASDGTLSTEKNITIDVTNYAFNYAVKERLISIKTNIPTTNPDENLCIIGLDVPSRMKTFCEEIYTLIHKSLGGYPNYVHVIWNDNGTEENAKPVLDKITYIQNEAITISDLRQNCLSGHDPGGERTPSSTPYSVCYETMDWTANPFDDGGSQFEKDIRLALHYGHEYFHHYQWKHALERGGDLQFDRENPSTTVQNPRWWTEGGAVTFQNAWFKKNFNSISSFTNSTWDDVSGISIASHTGTYSYKRIRRAIMNASGDKDTDCSADWKLTDETNDQLPTCNGWILIVPYLAHKTSWKTTWTDMYTNSYDLGFWGALEKFYGKPKEDFYAEFNAFLRSGNAEDEPPVGWAPSESDFIDADFLNMIPEGLL